MIGIPDSLVEFFEKNPRPALAFSGGVDSTYLMFVCNRLNVDMIPVYVAGSFQTVNELVNVDNLCNRYGFSPLHLEVNTLATKEIVENDENRCYYCKKLMFYLMWSKVRQFNRAYLMDGTNASDDPAERPGMKALEEMGVRSPLRECGITKEDVRRYSKEAGIPNYDAPSNSCLATRIATGIPLTEDLLYRTEKAEKDLRMIGLTNIRVRTLENDRARLEVPESQLDFLEENKAEVEQTILKYYDGVTYGTRKTR